MARYESDREDLLREATALIERVELAPTDAAYVERASHVTAGFRRDGAASIFFGADPVYHFNASGELRRAYCDGLLFKAARRRLVSLRRERQPGEVQLLRHELTDAEQREFLRRMRERIDALAKGLIGGRYHMVGQVPEDADIVARLQDWLSRHEGDKIAASPHAEGARKGRLG